MISLVKAAQAEPAAVPTTSSVHATRTDTGDGLCALSVQAQGTGAVFNTTADAILKLDSGIGQNNVVDRKADVYTQMRFHNKESTSVGDFPQAMSTTLPYNNYYALRMRGYINVTAANLLYTEAAYSVAGARMRIAGQTLVDFNSNTSVRETRQVSFAGPGLYPIEIIHYANGGIAVLEVSETPSAEAEGSQTSLDTSKFALLSSTQLYTARSGTTTSCVECGADADCKSGNYCVKDWPSAGTVHDGLCSACVTSEHCGPSCMKCAAATPFCSKQACVECLQDNQCAAGSRCIDSKCKVAPSCPAEPACGTDQSCDPIDGCVSPCGKCTDNLTCDTARNICVPHCTNNADCPSGSSCDLNRQLCLRVEHYVGGLSCAATPSTTKPAGRSPLVPGLVMFGLFLMLASLRSFRRHRRGILTAAVVFFCTATVGTANAQLSANAATFKPAIGPESLIVVDGTTTPGHLKPMFQAVFSYDNNPLRLLAGNGVILANTVPHLVGLHIMGGLGITRYLALGLDIPVVLYQGFDRRTPITDVPNEPGTSGIGDVRVAAKVRIINNEAGGFGLAFAPLVTFPSGKGVDLRGSDGFNIEPRVAMDYRFEGGHFVAVNVGFLGRTNSQNVPDQLVAHSVTYGAGAFIALPHDFGVLFDLSGAVAVQKIDLGSLYAPTELHGAVRWTHRTGFSAMLGAGGGLTNAVGSPQYRIFLSLGYLPVRRTTPSKQVWLEIRKAGDGTGQVVSDVPGIECGEVCQQPFPMDTLVTLTAEPTPDSEFVEWSGACSGNGTCSVRMKDAQQIGAHFRMRPDHSVVELRKHGDGTGRVVSDPPGLDCGQNCNTAYPEGRVTLTAHPDPDSVFLGWSGPCSGKERCEIAVSPGRPPEVVEAEFGRIVDPCRLRINEVIRFKTGEFTIEESSYGLLNEVARVLHDNPHLTLRIEGNTDTQAFRDRCDKHDMNPWLSRMRADAVKVFLGTQGIDERRLSTIGYGSSNPAVENNTPENRQLNRRTEFQRTDPDAMACPNFQPRPAPPAIGHDPTCGVRKK